MDDATLQYVMGAVAANFSFLVAGVVLAVGWRQAASRRLATVLVLEAMLFTEEPFATLDRLGISTAPLAPLSYVLPWALASAYVWFLTTLGTPLLRPLSTRIGRASLLAYPLVVALATWRVRDNQDVIGPLIGVHVLFVALVGLVVSLVALRSTAPGTPARARARWFLIAFGTRDGLWVALIASALFSAFVLKIDDASGPNFGMLSLALIPIYVSVLAYAILRSQLFDIDLRIRWGIQKGTIVGVIVALSFVAEKLAEGFLNKTFGWVIGAVLAGLLVFAAPRLNKLGERAARVALPSVEDTSQYVHFRKMEVYRAALESALETGGITPKEQQALERLRAKLGISEVDAALLETDARSGVATPHGPTTQAAPE